MSAIGSHLDSESRKEIYRRFCEEGYTPIYSQPWWMDAVCGPENWDVWVHEDNGGTVDAAMPCYFEERAHGRYITKAPLTQNNGIVFRHPAGAHAVTRAKFEERVAREAIAWVDSLGLAVYEQQYPTTFTNWLPFSWNGCTALPRYTYVIEDTSDLDIVWATMDSNARKKIRKGQRGQTMCEDIGPQEFWDEHEKIFAKQGLPCPFSKELWMRLHEAVIAHGQGEILCMRNEDGAATSILFVVWDGERAYQLLGGGIPEYMNCESYHALIWECVKRAAGRGLIYDFEGSMIERISKSFREFGGVPELYFRIRKVYSPDVIRAETEAAVHRLEVVAGRHPTT